MHFDAEFPKCMCDDDLCLGYVNRYNNGLKLNFDAHSTSEIADMLYFHSNYPHTGMDVVEERKRDLALHTKCVAIIKAYDLPISVIELVRISRSVVLGTNHIS